MKHLSIDGFAGGGGASCGLKMAGIDVTIAINHDPAAIRMHTVNHPKTLHLTEDIFQVDLSKYLATDDVVDVMWASPDCFPAGNIVLTDKGYKPIEDVCCFDRVLTHTGEFRTVTRTIKKNDWKFANIKIAGTCKFQATLNHPFLARKKRMKSIHGEHRTTITVMDAPEWVKAENLTSDYRVAVPINMKSIIPTWNGCEYACHNKYGKTLSWVQNELGKFMDNGDFWWLVGRYFGNGSLSLEKRMVDICANFDEIDEIKARIDKLDIKYTERDKKHTHSFLFSSKELCEFLKQFGIGAMNKSITPTIMNLPIDLLKNFAEGYLSADGCREITSTNTIITFTTISKNLAYGMQHVLLKAFGRYAGMTYSNRQNNNVIEGRTVNIHPIYTLIFYENDNNRFQYEIEDGIAWVNVKSVEITNDVQKSVYTLSVDIDESFTINNIAVHNCTSHSKAKGGQPRELGLRILPWAVYRLCRQIKDITGHLPSMLFMENVEEIQEWGPLNKQGQPIQKKKGTEYRRFIKAMKKLGFSFDSRVLTAADYGAPTTRKRWYAIFRSDGKQIRWPEPTHSKEPGGLFPLKPWIPVSTCLDFTDLGCSIFERKKPLADATLRRIANGIRKFIVENPKPYYLPEEQALPFLIQYHSETTSGDVRGQTLNEPLKTIDTSNRYALVSVFITKFYKTGTGQMVTEPLHTITTSPGHFGLVSVFLVKYYGTGNGQSVDEPLATITTKDRFGMVSTILLQDDERYAIADIYMRMLKPEELKLAQGFPPDYIIDHDAEGNPYPVKEQVAKIGNSVVPIMAAAICKSNLESK